MSVHPPDLPTPRHLTTEVEAQSQRWLVVDTRDDRPVAACTSGAALMAAMRLLGGGR
jgi:hypothetical protein